MKGYTYTALATMVSFFSLQKNEFISAVYGNLYRDCNIECHSLVATNIPTEFPSLMIYTISSQRFCMIHSVSNRIRSFSLCVNGRLNCLMLSLHGIVRTTVFTYNRPRHAPQHHRRVLHLLHRRPFIGRATRFL